MRSSYELAWTLADVVSSQLSNQDTALIYVELGCRHYRRAITETLEIAVRSRAAIPAALARDVADWLGTYPKHSGVQRIRELLQLVPIGRSMP